MSREPHLETVQLKINSVKSAYFQFMHSLRHNGSIYANGSMWQLLDNITILQFSTKNYYHLG